MRRGVRSATLTTMGRQATSRQWATAAFFTPILIVAPLPVAASDDGLEIDQACAVRSGCFAGDAAGYPVTITRPGSYQLSGDLDLTAEGTATSAIVLRAIATLDLAGFSILGPASCTGSGDSLSCGPAGAGTGVLLDPGSNGSRVHNGRVHGMGSSGVGGAASEVTIEAMQATANVLDGIRGNTGTTVQGCIAKGNGRDGIRVGEGSRVEASVAVGNGDDGVETYGPGTTVRGVSARANGADGIHTSGVSAVDSSTSSENGDDGISVGPESTVSRSSVRANTGAGIKGEGAVAVSQSSSADNLREGFSLVGPQVSFEANASLRNALPDSCGGKTCTERSQ